MSLDSAHLVSMVRAQMDANQEVFKAGYEAGYRQGVIEGTAEARKLLAAAEALIGLEADVEAFKVKT